MAAGVQARGRAAERVGEREVPAERRDGAATGRGAGARRRAPRSRAPPAPPSCAGRGPRRRRRHARPPRIAWRPSRSSARTTGSSCAGLAPALFEALHQVGELRAAAGRAPRPGRRPNVRSGVRRRDGSRSGRDPGPARPAPGARSQVGRRGQGHSGELRESRAGPAAAAAGRVQGMSAAGRRRRWKSRPTGRGTAGVCAASACHAVRTREPAADSRVQMMIHGAGASRDHACGGRGFSSSRVDRR